MDFQFYLTLLQIVIEDHISNKWGLVLLYIALPLPLPPWTHGFWTYFKYLSAGEPRAVLLLVIKLFGQTPSWLFYYMGFSALALNISSWFPILVTAPTFIPYMLFSTWVLDQGGSILFDALIGGNCAFYIGFMVWSFCYAHYHQKRPMNPTDSQYAAASSMEAATQFTTSMEREDNLQPLAGPSRTTQFERSTHQLPVDIQEFAARWVARKFPILMTYFAVYQCSVTFELIMPQLSKPVEQRSMNVLLFSFWINGVFVSAPLLGYIFTASRRSWSLICSLPAALISLTLLRLTAVDSTWRSWMLDASLTYFAFSLALTVGVFTEKSRLANRFHEKLAAHRC